MKTYRVYFNRCEDWPQVWSVDEGTVATEVNVIGVRLDGVRSVTRSGVVTDAAREPKAWLDVEADGLRIVHGLAVFVV